MILLYGNFNKVTRLSSMCVEGELFSYKVLVLKEISILFTYIEEVSSLPGNLFENYLQY